MNHTPEVPLDSPMPAQPSSTIRYMVGSIAVGIIIVSREQGNEVITPTEQAQIRQEVLRATRFLEIQEPRAQLTFTFDFRIITVRTQPGPNTSISDPYERYENGWRDTAQQQMGYATGESGWRNYLQNLRTQQNTRWAYVAFFTKYPLHHFAYEQGGKVVMQFQNDGWGPDAIHRVFAHETCHVFGAADEYGACCCNTLHGYLQIPNRNCVNCPGTQVPCLMNRNTLVLCEWTRKQIGWADSLFPK